MDQLESLRELVKTTNWTQYLDLLEGQMVLLFQEMFALDSNKPESFIKFVELKSKIDSIRDMTYFIERQVVESEQVPMVDQHYSARFATLLKKIWRKK